MTDKYAVIGNPIAHSKSPLIHKMFAEQTGQDISYEAVLAPLDGFDATVERLRREGYKGCNVTVPFKEQAFHLNIGISTSLSEYADNAKAANTLKFLDSEIEIDNTDGVGLVRDLEQNLGVDLTEKRLLLMGAGGAAKGVLLPLRRALRRVDANITIANRTVDRAHHLAKGTNVSICGYEELTGKSFDIVVNATSTGLTDEMPPLPPGIFAPGARAYDMMYGKETRFMSFARLEGAQITDGLGMLVEQAAEAFFIWRGVRPDTAPVIAALRRQ
jgi:shikimate dehydrogenase